MSELRQDPTTKEWVIIATTRARRPHYFVREQAPQSIPEYDPSCPFCPGNEHMTPPETARYTRPGSAAEHWSLRVVPNRYPALEPEGSLERRGDELNVSMDGVGRHEVIIDSPLHNRHPALMADEEMEALLRVCQQRYVELRDDPRIDYIVIFKNYGEQAGTSLLHPHSQIVATPVAPALYRRKYEVAVENYDRTGTCLYCDIRERELAEGTRVVMDTDGFVVFHPFASRSPFETFILPKQHRPSFGQVPQAELTELARVLRSTLFGTYQRLGNPDFNYVIHSVPTDEEESRYYMWHVQIVPRLTTMAGFEMGSGMYINIALPEETAAFMRGERD
jgi:UDPglucose--hexose-1-phosphate uridylyltransferase